MKPSKSALKSMLIFLLLVLSGSLNAQEINWPDSPEKTFVFEINNKEAEKLLKSSPRDSLILKMLHTHVADFVGKWENRPQQGHFIFADIKKNKVNFMYVPIIPFQVFLYKEYGALTLQIVDSKGEIRSDAKVRIRKNWAFFDSSVAFDATSKTYTIDDFSEKRERIMTVELDDFRAVFKLNKNIVNPWFGNYGGRQGSSPDFYSYMITDKNKYKPGETVRFKSYALDGNKRPLKNELEVWLRTSDAYNSFKKIKTLAPYHPGGFAGEIHLHDSLELKLDKSYNIQLREKNRRVVSNTSFRYEDYVLYDVKLDVELKSTTQYYPEANRIEITATDANGLPLLDTEAEIIIKRGNVLRTYVDIFVMPDTLLHETILLDNTAPTKFDIPAALPGEADCTYDVMVIVQGPDNQRKMYQRTVEFFRSHSNIHYTTHGDTIRFSFLELGKELNVKAQLSCNGSDENKTVELPYEEVFDQRIKSYDFSFADSLLKPRIYTHLVKSQLDVEGGIEKDSFNIKLINPLRLDVSWYLYQGNRLLEKGFGKELDFKYGQTDLSVTHYVEIFYFMGDKEQVFRRNFVPKTEYLSIDFNLPERIYPGQKLDASVIVKDNMGNPLPDVDLTAFAVNSQLNYRVPDLPYYGPSPTPREQSDSYSVNDMSFQFSMPLDYKFWNKIAGLDQMEYYRFTYPQGHLFTHTVDTPDSTTQFAPFVMKQGNSVNIYVIELNDTPVWFSWTEQPKSYAFVVSQNGPHKITLRLHDRAIILGSLWFEAGKKTILSLDMDNLPPNAEVVKLENKNQNRQYIFTKKETDRYRSYIAEMPVPDFLSYTYLKTNSVEYPVFHKCFSPRRKNILAGPLPEGRMQYMNSPVYRHEGGYSYQFEENVVYKNEAKIFPDFLQHTWTADFGRLNQFYLTPAEFDRQVDECLNRAANQWRPRNIYISQPGITLNFRLPYNEDMPGVSNLLFRNKITGELIYPEEEMGRARKFPLIEPGRYDIFLLYSDGTFIEYGNVTFTQNAYTEINMQKREVQPANAESMEWLELRTYDSIIESWAPVFTPVPSEKRIPGNMVSGFVYDTEGIPLPGVTIVIQGTSRGVASNIDGYFQLDIGDYYATLEFRFIGMMSKNVDVEAFSEISVVLEEDSAMLDEVVVVAFGAQKKEGLTGALAGSVSGIQIRGTAAPVSNSTEVETDGLQTSLGKPEESFEETEKEMAEAEARLYGELLQLNSLRSNFSDVGFWQPAIFTDKKGQAVFEITFPDNITRWDAIVYAMNRRLQTGTLRQSVKSYKPLMAELKTPGFLVDGDSAYFVGVIRNYTTDTHIAGNVKFALQRDTLIHKPIEFSSAYQEKLSAPAPAADSLTATYLFTRDDGYMDGEMRTIPIEPQGTELAKGTLGFLSNGDKMTFAPENNEEIHLSITGNPLDIYMSATNYLTGYLFACNEQLASKLMGLLNYKIYKKYAGEKFTHDRNINQIIRRLLDNRNDEQLWSWWGRSSGSSFWMSAHIMRALKMAKDAGYAVDLDLSKVEQDYSNVAPYRQIGLHDIEILHALSDWGAVQNYEKTLEIFDEVIARYEAYEDSLAKINDKYKPLSYLKEKMLLQEIRQRQNIGYSSENISRYLKKDALGAVYCDDGRRHRYWYADNLTTTLIAYRIVRNDPNLVAQKEAMQMYVLRTKSNGWNTYQASSAVAAILPDLVAESFGKKTPATVVLAGKENKTVTEFPFETKLKPGEKIDMEKKDGMPLIYSVYSIERAIEANAGDAFEVSTLFENGDTLQAGVPAKLTATVTVKQKNTEHVMIIIPIPAGCSYASKNICTYGREVHREHFKEKTVIFCENLSEGTYEFTVELLPRFTGKYILNPAKAELMYFPVVNANNEMKKVAIEENRK